MVGKDCILAKCKENSCTVVDHCGAMEEDGSGICMHTKTLVITLARAHPPTSMPLASRFLEYLLSLYLCQISFFSKLFE